MSKPTRTKLYRDADNGVLFGVCAGIADYFGIDRLTVRILTVLLALMSGFWLTVISYAVLAAVLDRKPDVLREDPTEDAFWREMRTRPRETARDLALRFEELDRRLAKTEAYVTSKQYKLDQELNKL